MGAPAAPDPWTPVAAGAAALALLGGFIAWAWKYVLKFFDLFSHAERIAELEQASATKVRMEELAKVIEDRLTVHEGADTIAHTKIDSDLAATRADMAKASDLARVETKLDQLLVDGFNRGAKRP